MTSFEIIIQQIGVKVYKFLGGQRQGPKMIC